MRKQFYLDLVERLKEITDQNTQESDIKHFDLWNRQIEFLEKENPFKFPAVFIEFLPITYKQLPGGLQQAEITFRLHVVQKTLAGSYDKAKYQFERLGHLDLIDRIHQKLHGWGGDYFGSLVRIGSTPNHDHEQIIDEIEIYKSLMVDISAVKDDWEMKELTVVLNTELDTGRE